MALHQSSITNVFEISPFNECYLPSVNRLTFEKIDSNSLYENNILKSDLQLIDTLHIFIGMDSGLFANYIMKQSIGAGSKYLFVELDEVFKLLSIDIPDKVKDYFFISPFSNLKEIITKSEFNLFILKNKFKIYYSSAAKGNSHDLYTDLSYHVEKMIHHEHFEKQVHLTQKIYLKQQLANISENILPAELLKMTFRGKTCLVLGGGPSLDEHIEWIKLNRKSLIIFSVSRIAGKLSKLGIKPDLIVSVDPQEHSFEVNKAAMKLSKESLFLSAYHTNHNIVAQWGGSILFIGSQSPWQSKLNDTNIEIVGPTVTNTAIYVAEEMGFDQILLCGVDFCHSNTGASHTVDTYTTSLFDNLGTMYEWVETYSGEMAETPIQLLQAIESLEKFVSLKPEVKYINLSKSAAIVDGVKYQEKETILLPSLNQTQMNILKPNIYQLSPEELIKKLKLVEINLIKTNSDFKKIIKKLTKALSICQKMQKKNSSKNLSLSNELDNIELNLKSSFPQICYKIKFYGYYEFSQFLTTQNTDNWTQQDVNEQHKIYYQTFYNIATELHKLTEKSLFRLQSRIAENSSPADLSLFLPQWEEDMHFGRAIIWAQKHPDEHARLSQNDKDKIEDLANKYYDLFNRNANKKVVNNHEKNMANAFKKINILLRNKNLMAVRKMIQYIKPFKEKDQLTSKFYYLAMSYELYLKGNWDEALLIILNLTDTQKQENELRHIIMLALKLNRLDIAQEHLAKIIQFNDEYLPQYAQIMNLQGQPQQALKIYLDYLDKFPENIPVLLKLGSFLSVLGETESAKSVFLQVLNIDPKNQTAKKYLA